MDAHLSVEARAAVHAALGDPTRLAVVDALLLGDASPSVLASRLGIASNLMAHHVKVLESAGLVSRVRSEGDRRRSYLRLHSGTLDSLNPVVRLATPRVVFVCTHNSARSQLAAALWRQHSEVPVTSAGTHPARRIHPRAVAAARRHSLGLGRARPAPVADVLTNTDLVVTVCDSAHEELEHELLRRSTPALHWSIPDPAARDTDEAFEAAYVAVATHVDRLAPAVRPTAITEP
jgi:ArsR family transcriptional regulator, arsenate/arsenite/antimonite-responsive transcriptional repressor / arsenate reductase (thioredoxin)